MIKLESTGNNNIEFYPQTLQIIQDLISNPLMELTCAHGDNDPVVGVYEVPRGCVALPGIETQPLCAHHRMSDGSFEGMSLIIDLSINSAWSRYMQESPSYSITDTEGSLSLQIDPEE